MLITIGDVDGYKERGAIVLLLGARCAVRALDNNPTASLTLCVCSCSCFVFVLVPVLVFVLVLVLLFMLMLIPMLITNMWACV